MSPAVLSALLVLLNEPVVVALIVGNVFAVVFIVVSVWGVKR